MKAIAFKKPVSSDQTNRLEEIEIAQPQATGRDILVRVEAISVNPVDYKVLKGGGLVGDDYRILGWDAAGIVEAVGEQVTLFKVGDKVFYAGELTRQGSNAEYQLVDERIVAIRPKKISALEAAALPLTSITAWEILFDRLRVDKTQPKKLLIVGAAGGVGSILIQLAKQLTQLEVIATASRPETQAWVKSLGADLVIDHKRSFSEQLAKDSIDYVISLNKSATHISAIAEVIKPQGKVGVIDNAEVMDVMPLMYKSISFHWELMFTRSMYKTQDMIEQHKLLTQIATLVDQGKIKTTLSKNLGKINAENLHSAHKMLESGESIGKLVLEGF